VRLSTFSVLFSAIVVIFGDSIIFYYCSPRNEFFLFVYVVATISLYFIVHWILVKKMFYKLQPLRFLSEESRMIYRLKNGVPVFFKLLHTKKDALSSLRLRDLFFQYIDIPAGGFFGGELSEKIIGADWEILFKIKGLYFVTAGKNEPKEFLSRYGSREGVKEVIETAIKGSLGCVFKKAFSLSDAKLVMGMANFYKKVFLDELSKLLKNELYKANIYSELDYRLFEFIITIK
jgi:hypothetical protein